MTCKYCDIRHPRDQFKSCDTTIRIPTTVSFRSVAIDIDGLSRFVTAVKKFHLNRVVHIPTGGISEIRG